MTIGRPVLGIALLAGGVLGIPAGMYLAGMYSGPGRPAAAEPAVDERGDGADESPPSPAGGRIAGRVVSAGEEEPVAGAGVVLDLLSTGERGDATTATDAGGRFELAGLAAGVYTVTAHHAKLVAPRRPRKLTLRAREEVADLELLLGRGLEARGTVVHSETGAPVAGAELVLRPAPGAGPGLYPDDRRKATTDAHGAYRLPGVFAGPHRVAVRASGYLLREIRHVPASSLEEGLDLDLDPGGAISGRVLDASGDPVVEARVSVDTRALSSQALSRMDASRTVTTDREGRYRVDGLVPDALYALVTRHPEYALSYEDGVYLEDAGSATRVDLRLDTGRRLEGRVLDAQGDPIPGATVQALAVRAFCSGAATTPMRALGGLEHRETTSDATGAYVVRHMAGRLYHVRAKASGYSPSGTLNVELLDGDRVEVRSARGDTLDIDLERPGKRAGPDPFPGDRPAGSPAPPR